MDLTNLHITYRNLLCTQHALRRLGFPPDAMHVVVRRQGASLRVGTVLRWFEAVSVPGVRPATREFAVEAGPLPAPPEDFKREWLRIRDGAGDFDPAALQSAFDSWLMRIGGIQGLADTLRSKGFALPWDYADPTGRNSIDDRGGGQIV